jgi:hypothetical protein
VCVLCVCAVCAVCVLSVCMCAVCVLSVRVCLCQNKTALTSVRHSSGDESRATCTVSARTAPGAKTRLRKGGLQHSTQARIHSSNRKYSLHSTPYPVHTTTTPHTPNAIHYTVVHRVER